MSDQQQPMPSEEELAAAYEAQLAQLRVEDVVLQTTVSLINLGARKAGLAGGGPEEVDPRQVKLAIDGATALLGLLQDQLGPDAGQLRDAISQLQLAYVKLGGEPPAEPAGGQAPPAGPGAQSSGRLWVPGQ